MSHPDINLAGNTADLTESICSFAEIHDEVHKETDQEIVSIELKIEFILE